MTQNVNALSSPGNKDMNRTPADLSAAFRKMTSFISLILKAALFDIRRLAMVSCASH